MSDPSAIIEAMKITYAEVVSTLALVVSVATFTLVAIKWTRDEHERARKRDGDLRQQLDNEHFNVWCREREQVLHNGLHGANVIRIGIDERSYAARAVALGRFAWAGTDMIELPTSRYDG